MSAVYHYNNAFAVLLYTFSREVAYDMNVCRTTTNIQARSSISKKKYTVNNSRFFN
jgi:hypothetical protein